VTTLCLFSSNIRPQYEQDIIDLAAAPEGHIYRFRYESRYIDGAVRDDWEANKLVDTKVLVLYSIQQPQSYHPPAFVPIRTGQIVRSRRDGSVFFVDFKLGAYAPLREPTDPETRGSLVAGFTEALTNALPGSPGAAVGARFSAASGEVPGGWLTTDGPSTTFERLVTYLAGTVSFSSHLFWRVAGVRELGGDEVKADKEGRFRLYSNRSYELTVVHHQPDVNVRSFGMTPGRFDLATDDSLVEVIGDKAFEVASRYDAIGVRVRVPAYDVKETILSIRPATDTQGPRADVRLLVGPGDGRRLAGGGLAATAVVLAAIPGLMSDSATFGQKVMFPVTAALLTVVLGYFAFPIRK
jgi:hypothetical protein